MTKNKNKTMITEHIFEVRYLASGTFLDVRGYVADYIKNSSLFPHWNIDTNVVHFRDFQKPPYKDSAFIGYKNAGYVVFDSPTKNYFQDKTKMFWKILNENKHYEIPDLLRVGIRTKAFFPLSKSFEDIRNTIYEYFFTQTSRSLIGGVLDDLQLIVDYKDGDFKILLRGGPIKKEEAKKYFTFEANEFQNNGLFLDLDFFSTENINHKSVPNLVQHAVNLTWIKLENIAKALRF